MIPGYHCFENGARTKNVVTESDEHVFFKNLSKRDMYIRIKLYVHAVHVKLLGRFMNA